MEPMTKQNPDPVTRQDVQGLREDTKELTGAVNVFATKAELADSTRLAKRANINSTLAAVALVLVAIVAFIGWQSNSSTLARFEADRVDRSRGSCAQFNVNQRNQRDAIVNGLIDTFRPLVTPEKGDQFRQFSADLRANVDRQLPFRDCSDAGIEEFLRNPPPDPASGG